jgi:hypothetical protein
VEEYIGDDLDLTAYKEIDDSGARAIKGKVINMVERLQESRQLKLAA